MSTIGRCDDETAVSNRSVGVPDQSNLCATNHTILHLPTARWLFNAGRRLSLTRSRPGHTLRSVPNASDEGRERQRLLESDRLPAILLFFSSWQQAFGCSHDGCFSPPRAILHRRRSSGHGASSGCIVMVKGCQRGRGWCVETCLI